MNRKVYVYIYNGAIRVSEDKPERFKFLMSPLTEMTKEQQERALIHFSEHIYTRESPNSLFSFGELCTSIADKFVEMESNL